METTHQIVRMRIDLPAHANVALPSALDLHHQNYKVRVSDRIEKQSLILDREVLIPAGRVQPDAYAPFVDFARRSDAAQNRDIVVTLRN